MRLPSRALAVARANRPAVGVVVAVVLAVAFSYLNYPAVEWYAGLDAVQVAHPDRPAVPAHEQFHLLVSGYFVLAFLFPVVATYAAAGSGRDGLVAVLVYSVVWWGLSIQQQLPYSILELQTAAIALLVGARAISAAPTSDWQEGVEDIRQQHRGPRR